MATGQEKLTPITLEELDALQGQAPVEGIGAAPPAERLVPLNDAESLDFINTALPPVGHPDNPIKNKTTFDFLANLDLRTRRGFAVSRDDFIKFLEARDIEAVPYGSGFNIALRKAGTDNPFTLLDPTGPGTRLSDIAGDIVDLTGDIAAGTMTEAIAAPFTIGGTIAGAASSPGTGPVGPVVGGLLGRMAGEGIGGFLSEVTRQRVGNTMGIEQDPDYNLALGIGLLSSITGGTFQAGRPLARAMWQKSARWLSSTAKDLSGKLAGFEKAGFEPGEVLDEVVAAQRKGALPRLLDFTDRFQKSLGKVLGDITPEAKAANDIVAGFGDTPIDMSRTLDNLINPKKALEIDATDRLASLGKANDIANDFVGELVDRGALTVDDYLKAINATPAQLVDIENELITPQQLKQVFQALSAPEKAALLNTLPADMADSMRRRLQGLSDFDPLGKEANKFVSKQARMAQFEATQAMGRVLDPLSAGQFSKNRLAANIKLENAQDIKRKIGTASIKQLEDIAKKREGTVQEAAESFLFGLQDPTNGRMRELVRRYDKLHGTTFGTDARTVAATESSLVQSTGKLGTSPKIAATGSVAMLATLSSVMGGIGLGGAGIGLGGIGLLALPLATPRGIAATTRFLENISRGTAAGRRITGSLVGGTLETAVPTGTRALGRNLNERDQQRIDQFQALVRSSQFSREPR